jgi:hypothetical protein
MASANGLALALTTTPSYDLLILTSAQCPGPEKQLPLASFAGVAALPGRCLLSLTLHLVEKISGGNPAVPGNDEISTSVWWRPPLPTSSGSAIS